jgi:hypothetical protein
VVYFGSYDHFVYAVGAISMPHADPEPLSPWMIAAVVVIVAGIVLVAALILKLLNKP